MRFVERKGRDGRPEWFAPPSGCWVVYLPPPGQSSGPTKVQFVRPDAFVGTNSAMNEILGPYGTQEVAEAAARRSAAASGYPDAAVY